LPHSKKNTKNSKPNTPSSRPTGIEESKKEVEEWARIQQQESREARANAEKKIQDANKENDEYWSAELKHANNKGWSTAWAERDEANKKADDALAKLEEAEEGVAVALDFEKRKGESKLQQQALAHKKALEAKEAIIQEIQDKFDACHKRLGETQSDLAARESNLNQITEELHASVEQLQALREEIVTQTEKTERGARCEALDETLQQERADNVSRRGSHRKRSV